MAQRALGAGTVVPRRRALFGLLDADGWGWASVKAFIWLVIIIFMLGYLPDRAYYFTVGRTVDLGVLVWSPINFCPPSNQSLPCPPPVGSIVPFETVARRSSRCRRRGPTARSIQVGTQIFYFGGSDGKTAQSSVYFAPTVGTGQLRQVAERARSAGAAMRARASRTSRAASTSSAGTGPTARPPRPCSS